MGYVGREFLNGWELRVGDWVCESFYEDQDPMDRGLTWNNKFTAFADQSN
jgi:hypothetical protein